MDLLHMTAMEIKVASLVPLAAALLVVFLLAGLRFIRRGPERDWLGPSFILLSLIPAAVGAGVSGSLLPSGLAIAAVAGYEFMALQARVLEAQLPLLAGLAASGIVSLVSLLLLSYSTSPAAAEPPQSSTRTRGRRLALGITSACAALLLFEIVAARAVAGGSPAADLLGWGVAAAALLTLLLLLGGGFVLATSAPATTPPDSARRFSRGGSAAVMVFFLTASAAGLIFVNRSLDALLSDNPPLATWEELATFDDPSLPPDALHTPGESLPESADASLTPRIVRAGVDIGEPQKLVHVDAVYPEVARRARVQGNVILECTITPDGRVSEVRVVKGQPLLNDAAIDAVRQWVYTPAFVDGQPVAVLMTVTLTFTLS
jgi:TonB family protein